MLTVAKIQPPMFALPMDNKPVTGGTAQYLANLLLHPDSSRLLMENSAERLKVICGAFTGNHPDEAWYLSNSAHCVTQFAFNNNEGGIFCYNCREQKGSSTYGNFLLPACNDCWAQRRVGWSVADPYYLDNIARAMLTYPAYVVDLLCAGISALDKQRSL